jgi:hypothetical protein
MSHEGASRFPEHLQARPAQCSERSAQKPSISRPILETPFKQRIDPGPNFARYPDAGTGIAFNLILPRLLAEMAKELCGIVAYAGSLASGRKLVDDYAHRSHLFTGPLACATTLPCRLGGVYSQRPLEDQRQQACPSLWQHFRAIVGLLLATTNKNEKIMKKYECPGRMGSAIF